MNSPDSGKRPACRSAAQMVDARWHRYGGSNQGARGHPHVLFPAWLVHRPSPPYSPHSRNSVAGAAEPSGIAYRLEAGAPPGLRTDWCPGAADIALFDGSAKSAQDEWAKPVVLIHPESSGRFPENIAGEGMPTGGAAAGCSIGFVMPPAAEWPPWRHLWGGKSRTSIWNNHFAGERQDRSADLCGVIEPRQRRAQS